MSGFIGVGGPRKGMPVGARLFNPCGFSSLAQRTTPYIRARRNRKGPNERHMIGDQP